MRAESVSSAARLHRGCLLPGLLWILAHSISCGASGTSLAQPRDDELPGEAAGRQIEEAVPDWERLRADWTRLGEEAASGRVGLRRAAEIDSLRQAWADAAISALGEMQPAFPPDPAGAWVLDLVREGLISGDTRVRRLLESHWEPESVSLQDPAGRLTLPAALTLASSGSWRACLDWLDKGALPDEEAPYGAVLQVEALLALEDTLGAGRRADRFLAGTPGLPLWAGIELEKAKILSLIAGGDPLGAAAALAGFSGRGEERGFWLVQQATLAAMRGRRAEADSLEWLVLREYPGGRTAGRLLRELVDPAAGPAAGLERDRLRALLNAAEHRVDLDRFLRLSEALSRGAGAASVDSLALREARVAFRARAFEHVVNRSWSRPWSADAVSGPEWGIIQGRAHRNTSRPDSMAAWFGRVLSSGSPQQRITAAWEWAREADYLRRFSEADSLYGVYLNAGGTDRRAEARTGQGLCRLSLGRTDAAMHAFRALTSHDDPDDVASGWFWIYRTELIRGNSDAARRALERAADGERGYYGWRARSALWAEENGGPGIGDPRGYWAFVNELGGRPVLDGASVVLEDGSGASPAADWRRKRDLLLLFRHTGRPSWARRVQDDLAAIAGRADAQDRVSAYLRLGLPDLAARSAVRSGMRRAEWTHPTPFASAVAGASAAWGIAPEWIWSVMRRESFFESAAVSSAGAAGLMQLMEATARETAGLHGLEEGPLYSPRVNLLLGVAHLADLREKEPHDWPVVLAAYNAGLHNARRWRHPDDDPDFYVERIGYAETRTYARRVLEGFWIYRRILRAAP